MLNFITQVTTHSQSLEILSLPPPFLFAYTCTVIRQYIRPNKTVQQSMLPFPFVLFYWHITLSQKKNNLYLYFVCCLRVKIRVITAGTGWSNPLDMIFVFTLCKTL